MNFCKKANIQTMTHFKANTFIATRSKSNCTLRASQPLFGQIVLKFEIKSKGQFWSVFHEHFYFRTEN